MSGTNPVCPSVSGSLHSAPCPHVRLNSTPLFKAECRPTVGVGQPLALPEVQAPGCRGAGVPGGYQTQRSPCCPELTPGWGDRYHTGQGVCSTLEAVGEREESSVYPRILRVTWGVFKEHGLGGDADYVCARACALCTYSIFLIIHVSMT